jgi:hypothetical protein
MLLRLRARLIHASQFGQSKCDGLAVGCWLWHFPSARFWRDSALGMAFILKYSTRSRTQFLRSPHAGFNFIPPPSLPSSSVNNGDRHDWHFAGSTDPDNLVHANELHCPRRELPDVHGGFPGPAVRQRTRQRQHRLLAAGGISRRIAGAPLPWIGVLLTRHRLSDRLHGSLHRPVWRPVRVAGPVRTLARRNGNRMLPPVR